MKVGGPFPGNEVPLPPEVLELIIRHINRRTPRLQRQHDLWTCCLLSTPWYAATIRYLYRSPLLRTRNYDLFARTLCPPVNSHVRRIGLETFVVNLDMGQLAYESTRSLTARLLRRTRLSLESFTAPSVSFSLAGLAPLSKARRLQHLDLSHDFYDISLAQLLRAICELPELRILSLPQNALKAWAAVPRPAPHHWPPNLIHLQLNGLAPPNDEWWNNFVVDVPDSLRTLTLNIQSTYGRHESLDCIEIFEQSAEQITSVHVKHGTWGLAEIVILSEVFPSLKHLSVPYGGFHFEELYRPQGPTPISPQLECLYLMDSAAGSTSDQLSTTNNIRAEGLDIIIDRFPMLKRIEVPGRFAIDFDADSGDVDMDDLLEKFHARWPSKPEPEVGVFLGPSLDDEDPPWIKKTWGLPATKQESLERV